MAVGFPGRTGISSAVAFKAISRSGLKFCAESDLVSASAAFPMVDIPPVKRAAAPAPVIFRN
jgi:hypothetical protein